MPEQTENRTVVAGLPWTCTAEDWWTLDIAHLYVYVRNNPDGREGWRVCGMSAVVMDDLNDGKPYESRDAAMQAAFGVARFKAVEKLRHAEENLRAARTALEEVILPL